MANTVASLTETFKYVQENVLNDLKPNSAKLQEMAGKLKAADTVGRKFLWPVSLSYELGFTFGDGTAFAYNDDVAGVYDEIEIDPNPVVLKSRVSLEAAERMTKNDKARLNHVALRSTQMKLSLMKIAEIDAMLGRSSIGIGVVTATSGSGTTRSYTLSDATWAPGIWSAMEGVKLEARNTSDAIRNANADVVLTNVNFDTKTLTVSGNETDLDAIVATDRFFFKGAFANGQYGLFYQLNHSGSVFGIDNSTYSLWKGNEQAVGGALTITKVLEGAEKAVSKGGLDEDCVLITSTKTYEGMNTDLAALRNYDQSYSSKKGVNGFEMISYQAQFGSIEVCPHPYFPQGYSMLLPKNGFKKIGSTDHTFGIPGRQEEYFDMLQDVAAIQMLCRYSWQMLLNQPAKSVLYTGITN